MTAQKNLNSTVRILEHAKEEGSKFGDPHKRAADYLAKTKTPEELQEMKQALLDLLQNPPIKKPGQSDSDYVKCYNARKTQCDRYEKLLDSFM